MNHTQEQWTLQTYKSDGTQVITAGKNGFIIAEVTKSGAVGQLIGNNHAEANAKLIAAAPDLLKALILAKEIIDRLSDDYAAIANKHANHTMGEARIITDAINKATL